MLFLSVFYSSCLFFIQGVGEAFLLHWVFSFHLDLNTKLIAAHANQIFLVTYSWVVLSTTSHLNCVWICSLVAHTHKHTRQHQNHFCFHLLISLQKQLLNCNNAAAVWNSFAFEIRQTCLQSLGFRELELEMRWFLIFAILGPLKFFFSK